MAASKAKNTATIHASLYGGEFQVFFDCVGVETCRYALCSLMPPDGSEECTYRQHGSCLKPAAQNAAIEKLRNKLTKELKDRSSQDDGVNESNTTRAIAEGAEQRKLEAK